MRCQVGRLVHQEHPLHPSIKSSLGSAEAQPPWTRTRGTLSSSQSPASPTLHGELHQEAIGPASSSLARGADV